MDPRRAPGGFRCVLGLARATFGEGMRDPAVFAAVALLTALVLSLHATTQFALGAEDVLRAEMAGATLGLGAAAVVAVSLFRVGGAEIRDGTAVPLWATPLSRGGWVAGRILGLSALAALAVGVLAVGAASVSALAGRSWGAGGLGVVALAATVLGWTWGARGGPGRLGRFGIVAAAVAVFAGAGALLAAPAAPAGAPGLLLSSGAALLAGAVLAATGVAASLAVPPAGAGAAVVVLYVLGHASGPALLGAGPVARVAVRALVPDLGGLLAGAALAGGAGAAAYGLGMALIAVAAARAREA